ncbi:uncharacterized protein LOC117176601 [Belonocnema kinseyi]|uniref:uncharacterized protein LOC117176601 n=1 Tax=Belonocnema kinseyi TaxID=2817044 RepID=UPI00143DB0AF|nr:uncharacterized protein LOC117176601 [Belonocnema kinseyi]
MGDLSSIRITPPKPAFINTGVAYAGPIHIHTSNERGHHSHKAWICIFVCGASHSVHLELFSDCTAEAFIVAYICFTSRLSLFRTLSSDEDTNFWRFNPPAALHFGGLWEAAVKSTKFHLHRVIGDSTLTFEEMTTLLTQIEACLNSRPLIAQSDDPTYISALTPGHFLIGGPLHAVPKHRL